MTNLAKLVYKIWSILYFIIHLYKILTLLKEVLKSQLKWS